jgi:hypothetical protein
MLALSAESCSVVPRRMSVKPSFFYRTQSLVQLALVLLAMSALGVRAEEAPTIYFYSPETSVDNYGSLKAEFDSYLSRHGTFTFQPFSDRETFEEFSLGKTNCLLIISSWHFASLRKRTSMEPLLVGVLGSKTTQRRILCASRSVGSVDLLKGERIAAAGTDEHARTILRDMLRTSTALADPLNILVVPKDIDALMAVSFRVARASLTTEESLARLGQINPKQHAQLQILAISEEVLLPIVASKGASMGTGHLAEIMRRMPEQTEGRRLLRMLGVESFKAYGEATRVENSAIE